MLKMTQLVGFASSRDDETPSSFLSANSTTVAENSVLAFTVTTDEDSTIFISGTDAANFEIASNTLSTTHTLRWVADGTKDFEAPDDDDDDNVYEIILTALDAFANPTTQAFSVTVTDIDDWLSSVTPTMTTDWSAYTLNGQTTRQVMNAAGLARSGAEMRLLLQAGNGGGFSIDAMYIGEQASSGDAYDMKASDPAPAQILVSGSGTITASAGQTITTDALAFTIDETKTYIVSTHYNGASTVRSSGIPPSGSFHYHKSAVSEAATANVTGYSTDSGAWLLIKSLEIRGKLIKPQILIAYDDVFYSPTVS